MPFSIAIVGSGPAGFYVAEALLDTGLPVAIDIIERLPVPFGLVRYGVAPDHQKLKGVTEVFTRIAESTSVAFFGNVEIGGRLSVADLLQAYDAVVVATGALSSRTMDVPGENLPGSVSATDFVAWYNGHPHFQELTFDFSGTSAVVIGNGNVAIDVCRILAKSVDELKSSDISRTALDALSESRIRDIHLVGRRGPAQSKFTTKELRELGELGAAVPVVDPGELVLGPESEKELAVPSATIARRNLEILRGFSAAEGGRDRPKRIHFHFLRSPRRIHGSNAVEAVEFDRNRLVGEAFSQRCEPTGETDIMPTGLVIRSVGYRGAALCDVPFEVQSATIPNADGRVVGMPRLYTAGWIKRGPSGVIGSNRVCGLQTAAAVVADLSAIQSDAGERRDGRGSLRRMLGSLDVVPVDFDGWRRIDEVERRCGATTGRPRDKLTSIAGMLAVAAAPPTYV